MVEATLPDAKKAQEDVLAVAMKVKEARVQAKREGPEKVFACPQGPYNSETKEGGCICCRPYEMILANDPSMEYVGVGGFNQDMYIAVK